MSTACFSSQCAFLIEHHHLALWLCTHSRRSEGHCKSLVTHMTSVTRLVDCFHEIRNVDDKHSGTPCVLSEKVEGVRQ
jgi:hypothetical protein